MRSYKCENCGAELKKDGEYFSCQYCHTTYRDDSIEKAYNRLYANLTSTVKDIVTEELMNARLEKIANCRQNLYRARTGAYIDSKEIAKWSDEILKLNPDDVQATFYSIAAKERWQDLNAFLATINAREVSYFVPDFVDFLTNGRFVEECMLRVTDLIARAFSDDSKEYELCQKKIKRAADDERSGIFDEKLPRDVFVAYSSKDKERAYELVEYLELNGFSCFIAMRNLAKGVNAEMLYNDRLKAAIDNCRVFALVSSRNSRARNCDAFNIEMRYVKDCDIKKSKDQNAAAAHYELYLENHRNACKPRVEYLIEDYANGIYEQEVKKFFGGLTWQKTKEGVCKAVYDYVENMPVEEDVEAELKRKTAESERQKIELEKQRLEIERQKFEFEKQREELEAKRKAEQETRNKTQSGGVANFGDNSEMQAALEYFREQQAKIKAEEEAKRKAEEEKRRIAEEKRRAEEELRERKIEETRRKVEETRRKVEEAKRKEEEDCENKAKILLAGGYVREGDKVLFGLYPQNYLKDKESYIKGRSSVLGGKGDDGYFGTKERYKDTYMISPIQWRVLEEKDGKALLLAENILHYSPNCSYNSEYKDSPVRKWLNGGFLSTAFSDAGRERIIKTRINNDNYSYKSEATEDKIFLLSRSEAARKAYGFVDVIGRNDALKEKSSTTWARYEDYFKTRGRGDLPDGWWLRSPTEDPKKPSTGYVDEKGCITFSSNLEFRGVVPALWLDLATVEEMQARKAAEEKKRAEEQAKAEQKQREWAERKAAEAKRKEEEKARRKAEQQQKEWEEASRKYYEQQAGFDIEKSVLVKYIGKGGDVVIPNNVTSIGKSAFEECANLKSVTIPNSVTKIENCAFYACSNLISVALPDSLVSIGYSAFWGCSSLKSVTIPNSVTSIGSREYEGCASLTNVTIPDSVTNIGGSAFLWCERLTSVTIPNSVTNIGESAFYGCSSLTSIAIPSSVTNIGSESFSRCLSLTSIAIPNSVTNIGGGAFEGCSSLTSVTIPNSVTYIGSEAFYGCERLTSVTIPSSVTYIDADAFKGCPNLTIYAVAAKKPDGWVQKLFGKEKWNPDKRPVVWGHKGK